MTYTQLVTPDLDPEINEGGEVLTDWLGWCLAYAKNAYKAFGNTGGTAWEAWTNAEFKHTEEVPTGVYLPVWFEGYKGMGHVAILYKRPDGQVQIWSSPISHKPYADVWGSIGEIERRYAVEYVGWSEDIAGVRVIKGEEMATEEDIKLLFWEIFDRDPSKEQYDFFVGKELSFVIANIFESEQFKNQLTAERNAFDQVNKLTEENKALKEQIANPPQNPDQVIITKDSLWAKFKKLIGA